MIENPIFLSVSGSHLYGIPDPKDIDIRGAHVYPLQTYLRMGGHHETLDKMLAGNVDLVSHEIGKFLKLLVAPNVTFIEEVLSPLSIVRSKWYTELQQIARDCVSKAGYSHWKGFAKHTSYHAVQEDYKKPKRNLYLLRIYYQALYVLKNGKLRSDFGSLKDIEEYNDALVTELFECKKNKADFFNKQQFLAHCGELEKILAQKLETNKELRDAPSAETKEQASDLCARIRGGN